MLLTGSACFYPDHLVCSSRVVRVSCIVLSYGHYVVCLMGAIRVFMSAVTSIRVSNAVCEI